MPLHGNYGFVASGTPERWRCGTARPKAVITVPVNRKESLIVSRVILVSISQKECGAVRKIILQIIFSH